VAFAGEVVDDVDTVRLRAFNGVKTDALSELLKPAGTGLGGKVAVLRRPMFVTDYVRDRTITHDFDDSIRVEGLVSVLAAPIMSGHRFLGVLYAATRCVHRFSPEEVEQLDRIARRCGLALEVASRARELSDVAVQEERRRLAMTLHDSVGAMLFGITAAARRLSELHLDEPAGEIVEFIRAQGSLAAAAMRQALEDMAEPPDPRCLAVALKADCLAFQRRTGTTATVALLDELPPLSDDHVRVLRQVAHEALVNVEKHAQASSVVVALKTAQNGVAMAVADDGVGLPSRPQAGGGLGLKAIRERIARLNGWAEVINSDEGGCVMRVWLPW
jgi:signal transduction histidine kinase